MRRLSVYVVLVGERLRKGKGAFWGLAVWRRKGMAGKSQVSDMEVKP